MAQLPDVPCEPKELTAAFEAFSLGGANPLEEYRRWLIGALRNECIRRKQVALQAEANRGISEQLVEYAAKLMPDPETPVPPEDDTVMAPHQAEVEAADE